MDWIRAGSELRATMTLALYASGIKPLRKASSENIILILTFLILWQKPLVIIQAIPRIGHAVRCRTAGDGQLMSARPAMRVY